MIIEIFQECRGNVLCILVRDLRMRCRSVKIGMTAQTSVAALVSGGLAAWAIFNCSLIFSDIFTAF